MHSANISADANRIVNVVYKQPHPQGLEVLRIIPHTIVFQRLMGVDKQAWVLTATDTVRGVMIDLQMEHIWAWSPE